MLNLPTELLCEIFKFSRLALFNYKLALFNSANCTNIHNLFLETELNKTEQFELLYRYSSPELLTSVFATDLVNNHRIDLIEFLSSKGVNTEVCLTVSTLTENEVVFKWFVDNGKISPQKCKEYYDSFTNQELIPNWLQFIISTTKVL